MRDRCRRTAVRLLRLQRHQTKVLYSRARSNSKATITHNCTRLHNGYLPRGRHQPELRGTKSTRGPRSFHLKASLPADAPRTLEPHPLPLSTWRPSPIRPSRRSLLASAAIPVAASHARPHPKNRCKLVPVLSQSATAAVSRRVDMPPRRSFNDMARLRRLHTCTHRPARRCGQEWGVKGNVHVWRNIRRVGRGERGRLWERPREVRAELARVCACTFLWHE